MKRIFCLASFSVVSALSSVALAQEGSASSEPPPARVGFQMALRTGWAVPMGKLSSAADDDISNGFGGQVPIFVEIGGKPIPNLFIGGYFGLGFGGAAGLLGKACSESDVTCIAIGV